MIKIPMACDMWAKFRAAALPVDASESQVLETRTAFYAGVAAMHEALTGTVSGLPDEIGVDWLEAIREELLYFARTMAVRHVEGPTH